MIINPRCKCPLTVVQFYHTTLVKESASIGANATIVCGNTLGKHCLIRAGSIVTKNVPGYALVVGNLGKVIGSVSEVCKNLNLMRIEKHFAKNVGKIIC